VLVYPLFQGKEWTYREPNSPFHIGKKVLNQQLLSTTAGIFFASRIAWMWDINNDLVWDQNIEGYDYIGANGLIKRIFIYKDLVVSNESNPEGIGYIDYQTEYTLVSLESAR
jgi:hypothetical protein